MRRIIVILSVLLLNTITFGQPTNESDLKEFNEFLGSEKATALDSAVASFERFLEINYPDADTRQDVNFPNKKTYADRVISFLLELDSACNEGMALVPDTSWTLDPENDNRLVNLFENSGLRKEIWLYGYEEYAPNYDLSKILDINAIFSSPEKYSPVNLRSDSELISEAECLSKIESYDYDSLLESLKIQRERRKNSLYPNEYGKYIQGLIRYSEDDSYASSFAELQLQMTVSPCTLVSSLIEFNGSKVDLSDPFIKRIVVVELYSPIIYNEVLEKK